MLSFVDDDENGVRIDVPAFPIASERSQKKSSEEATSSDTEVTFQLPITNEISRPWLLDWFYNFYKFYF